MNKKFEQDIAEIKNDVKDIKSDTKRNTDSLQEHMRRTNALEKLVENSGVKEIKRVKDAFNVLWDFLKRPLIVLTAILGWILAVVNW